jgi:hypothetical protein
MAQRKFIIDGGFKTDDASELLANLTMGGSIIPDVNSDGTTGYDLGSSTAKWKDLYLSAGSLYINNQKVLQDDSGTIIVSADEDQGMTVKVTGTGVLALQSATTTNVNSVLQMQSGKNITDSAGVAVGFGDKIDMNNNLVINVGTAVAATDAANKSYVDGEIASLINGAPGAMDTLNELANAMGDDAAFSATVTNSIAVNAAQIATNVTGIASNATDIATNSALIVTSNAAWAAADAAVTSAMQTYADAAETDAIASAESKDVARMVTSNAYADASESAAIATAASDATTKADAALAAAVVADGVVSAAYVAADTAQTTSINSAWAAADASQTTSINSAWAAADAVVTTAFAAADTAQTTSINSAWAAGDAAVTSAMQSYADTAEADAVATAAADATAKIDALIDSAPGTMNTLNELAAAMGDDANHVTTMTATITAGDSASVSTASSDATTKADAALAAAKVYADANDANDNTTYTAGNGMTLSGTSFLMSGSYTGSFTATGDITAYSDESLKTNIQVIDGALGRVEAIRGVTFDRIEDGSTSTGVVAHELEAVLPEAVHTDVNGLKSVAYGNITGLLIEAVKELSAQVAELKAK